ncbi:MAG: hypothetical protein RJB60_822, partial [Pseudomonadota bacterium]|jgi:hypothetical protein
MDTDSRVTAWITLAALGVSAWSFMGVVQGGTLWRRVVKF